MFSVDWVKRILTIFLFAVHSKKVFGLIFGIYIYIYIYVIFIRAIRNGSSLFGGWPLTS